MRYSQIRTCDIANGEGIGVALFVQGCHFKCKNCFNPETWDFNSGKEWTSATEKTFIDICNSHYAKRITLLGGECLSDENLNDILKLIHKICILFPSKKIWLYTGYTWEEIFNTSPNPESDKRKQIVSQCDVLVDGRYIESKRDISLKWCGSSNQRVIDVQNSLKKGDIVLWR